MLKSQAFAYDAADRLTSATGGYGTIGYTYDANGNRLSKADAAGVAASTYEPASNRLSSSGATTFLRDVAGNRLTDGQFAYTYAVNNRLIAVADALGNAIASYVHNGKGERTSKTVNGVTTLYMYDPAGNLIGEYDVNGNMIAEYVYGPNGRLATVGTQTVQVAANENDTFSLFAWVKSWFENMGIAFADDDHDRDRHEDDDRDGEGHDGHEGDGNGHGNHGGNNGHGGNGNDGGAGNGNGGGAGGGGTGGGTTPPTFSTVEVIYWHHNDHLGTPQALTDVNGTVVWTMSQTPFGIATVNEDPDGDGVLFENNFRMPGQYYDQETGLFYNKNRYYDPIRAGYTQYDPIGLIGGFNPFTYAAQSPVNALDSTGLKVEWGNYILKNSRVVSNILKLNQAVISTGKDDECFTIRITGGDSYVDNNGVVRSSTNHMPVIDSNGRARSVNSAHNDHKGNRAVDIAVEGNITKSDFLNLVEPNSEFVLNPNLKYSDSHIHLRIPR